MSLNTKKIAIIGGGFAGMHISRLIHNKYPGISIQVYEQNEELGGKIKTYKHLGDLYDMGAITGVRNVYDGVQKLFGKSFKKSRISTSVYNTSTKKTGHLFSPKDRIKLVIQLLKYTVLRAYFSGIQKQAILELPFYDFCQKFHLRFVEIQFRAIFCGCGYGSNKTIPTFYVFHHASFTLLFNLYFGGFRFYPESIQKLLIKEFLINSPQVQVHVNTTISKIIHKNGKITLVSKDAIFQSFDLLILACNPVWLAADTKTLHPFKKMIFLKYNVSLIEYEDLDYNSPHVISFETNMEDLRDHSPVMIFFTQPSKPYGLTYYYPLSYTNEKLLKSELQKLGFRVKSIVHTIGYDNYFPHYKSDKSHEIKSIQGKNNTYYVGESVTFSVLPSIVKSNEEVFALIDIALKTNN